MANVTIQFQSFGTRETLQRLTDAIGAPVILDLVAGRILSYVDESFRTRGRGKWRPLSWGTLALRKRGGDAPLQDTGLYRESFTKETDRATFVEVGTNLKTPEGTHSLGKIHEQGTGPYVIHIKRARMLAAEIGGGANAAGEHGPISFIGNGAQRTGRWMFFGKEVHHPGIQARPVLPESASAAEDMLRPTIDGALERALKG